MPNIVAGFFLWRVFYYELFISGYGLRVLELRGWGLRVLFCCELRVIGLFVTGYELRVFEFRILDFEFHFYYFNAHSPFLNSHLKNHKSKDVIKKTIPCGR